MSSIILLNKPFQTLCQFTDEENRRTLSDCLPKKRFPDFYPAGRLDYDSEGLVVLCNDGALQHQISHPKHKLTKQYWVQVEGNALSEQIQSLRSGLTLKDGPTLPCHVEEIDPPVIWERNPPIRKRANIPTTWLNISLSEGRNRQVRRMTAAVKLPTLRLIRHCIGSWGLVNLLPGEYRVETEHLPKADKRRIRAKRR